MSARRSPDEPGGSRPRHPPSGHRHLLARSACRVLAGHEPDWSRDPATSAHARLSALDMPTAVAAARASTARVWAPAAHTPAVAWPSPRPSSLRAFAASSPARRKCSGPVIGAPFVSQSGTGGSARRLTRRARPLGIRHQRVQNGTMLHQPPQTPGSGDLLPGLVFCSKEQRSRDGISRGHRRHPECRPELASSQARHAGTIPSPAAPAPAAPTTAS